MAGAPASSHGASVLQSASVNLTSAQIKALGTTGIKIVDVGTGDVAVVIYGVAVYLAGTTPYADPGGNGVVCNYGPTLGTPAIWWTNWDMSNTWTQATSQVRSISGAGFQSLDSFPEMSGQSIYLIHVGGNPTLGDGTTRFTAWYVTVTL